MNKENWKLIMGGGGFAAAVALILGFLPRTYQGTNCGSLFVDSGEAFTDELTNIFRGRAAGGLSNGCEDVKSAMMPFVVILGLTALVLLVWGFWMMGQLQDEKAAAGGDPSAEVNAQREEASVTPVVDREAVAGADIAAQLQRLADLRDRGALSDDDFAAAKRKVLEG